MPIEVHCTSCQRTFRVPDKVAGKKIKCPKCANILPVPGQAATSAIASSASNAWHVKTADGQEFGPVSKAELDGWVAEGRLDADSQVLQAGAPQWQWASDVYPQLAAPTPSPAFPSVAAARSGSSNIHTFDTAGSSKSSTSSSGPFDFAAGNSSAVGGRSGWSGKSRAAANGERSDKSKMVAGLLGIFLGYLGVHRFYLGYTKIGIIQLLVLLPTCGLSSFWGLVEGIMIFAGAIDRDARGRKLRD